MEIILARAEKTKLVPDGKFEWRDANWFPTFTTAWEGKACVWILNGDETDRQKAERFANRERWSVFTYPVGTQNSLSLAKEAAVKIAEQNPVAFD